MEEMLKGMMEEAHEAGIRMGAKVGFVIGIFFGVMAPYFIEAIVRMVN